MVGQSKGNFFGKSQNSVDVNVINVEAVDELGVDHFRRLVDETSDEVKLNVVKGAGVVVVTDIDADPPNCRVAQSVAQELQGQIPAQKIRS